MHVDNLSDEKVSRLLFNIAILYHLSKIFCIMDTCTSAKNE